MVVLTTLYTAAVQKGCPHKLTLKFYAVSVVIPPPPFLYGTIFSVESQKQSLKDADQSLIYLYLSRLCKKMIG